MGYCDYYYSRPPMLCNQYDDCCIENRSYHSNQRSFQLCRFDKEDVLQVLQEYICETNHEEKEILNPNWADVENL